jgi:hypothetical protein
MILVISLVDPLETSGAPLVGGCRLGGGHAAGEKPWGFLRPKLRKGEGAYGWGILGNFGRKLRIDFGDFVTERISKVGIGPPTDVVIHATKCGMVGRH